MRHGVLFASIILIGAGCARSMPSHTQKVTFTTSDGVTIVGDYVDAGAGAPHALLLHMMPATRASYAFFALKLREAGISSLAIDFRGHGESVRQCRMKNAECRMDDYATLDYRDFLDAEHQAKILDVRAAVDWLAQNHGAQKSRLTLVGASIGANLALQYLKENPEVPAAVLLSPGLNYRSVLTEPLARSVKSIQAIYFAASADDEESFETNRVLAKITPAAQVVKEFKVAGHGTTMLEKEQGFMEEVVGWIKRNVK